MARLAVSGQRPAGRTPSREKALPMRVVRDWIDPFDRMSDEELDAHLDELFAARPTTVAVSLRMAPDLLSRVKRHFEIRRSLPNVHERHSRGRGLAPERTSSRSSRRGTQRKKAPRKAS